jgi:diguanylate cyclase (GGDEF)-like protein
MYKGFGMKKILLVEDTRLFSDLITARIESSLGIPVVSAKDMAGAREILNEMRDDISFAILDLTLPDARDMDIVNFACAEEIPSVVFTGSFDVKLRAKILESDIIDYVTKDSPGSVDYLLSIVRRVSRNQDMLALVVDDSAVARKLVSKHLQQYRLNVLEAEDGATALKILEENHTTAGNKISLVISDFEMPGMDGAELIRAIRHKWSKNDLAVIGLSSSNRDSLSARFIKNGANDFLSKPFLPEEFFCRISQNLDTLDRIKALRRAARRDYLTGMYNRRFFFETATPIFANAARSGSDLTVAMIDIDHFKSVNDTYGHDVGDEVLKSVAESLTSLVRETDIIARFGGEEFCLLAPAIAADDVPGFMEKIRDRISNLSFQNGAFSITVSIGATSIVDSALEPMITQADNMLYQAKESGRNRVVIETADI